MQLARMVIAKMGYKVFLDGADVTRQCMGADTDQHTLRILVKDAAGNPSIVEKSGKLRIEHGDQIIYADQ